MTIVYEAESGEKFVVIEPKRLIGNSILLNKETFWELTILIINRKLGSHTANTKTNTLTRIARTI